MVRSMDWLAITSVTFFLNYTYAENVLVGSSEQRVTVARVHDLNRIDAKRLNRYKDPTFFIGIEVLTVEPCENKID